MNQARQNGAQDQRNSGAYLVAFIANSLATSVYVFLHRGFGARYLGNQAAAVILIVIANAAMWPNDDPTFLLAFLGLYLIGCAGGRADIVRRRRRGDVEQHSYYNGTPKIMRWPYFRKLSERTVKRSVEPYIVIVSGMLLMAVSRPLGGYLMIAWFGMLISMALTETYERERLADMRDALIDQRNLAERFREGDRR